MNEPIAAVDAWQLGRALPWPIMRLFARRFVEQYALSQYERSLLATHRWSTLHVVPHTDERGIRSTHLFDISGEPAPRDAVNQFTAS
jgi:hypothetical protein